MENQKFTKNIIPIEIELGFVRIPNQYKNLFPKKNVKIKAYLGNQKTSSSLGYNSKVQRITGLVKFFRSVNVKPKDILEFEKLGNEKFRLIIKKISEREKQQVEFTKEEAKQMIDAGRISGPVKGNIVEERIAHLIFLYSQGLLNVYKPTADIDGIDKKKAAELTNALRLRKIKLELVRSRRDESEPLIRLADRWAGCIRAAFLDRKEEKELLERAKNKECLSEI